MKDRPEPERIEIELTSNVDPAAGELGDDIVVSGSSDHAARPTTPVQPDQRRVFAVAAVVGVLALLLGWLIGRSAGGDEVATTSVTTPETTEAVAETVMPGETLPSASTTRPRRTTTSTTLAPATIETIEIDPRLEGVDLRLVGSERGSVLVEVDLAERTVTRQDIRRSFEPEAMVVGEDWILFQSFGGGTSYLLHDGESQQVEFGEVWELLWQVGTDRFWRPAHELEAFSEPSSYQEIDLTGRLTGVTLELPIGTWVHHTDPRGGLIVEAAGKTYSVSESGISLIGVGEMIGLSSDVAALRDCDEQLRCGLFVTDRQTGAVRGLELDPPGDELLPIESTYGWGPPGHRSTISPDGTVLVVMLPSYGAPLLALIDLSSGAVVELGETWWLPTVVWSSDSRFAFFLEGDSEFPGSSGGGLKVYDRESGEVFPVSSQQLDWQSLAARPAGS